MVQTDPRGGGARGDRDQTHGTGDDEQGSSDDSFHGPFRPSYVHAAERFGWRVVVNGAWVAWPGHVRRRKLPAKLPVEFPQLRRRGR
jgi:hypothetical protein